jgi:hypothetical protein
MITTLAHPASHYVGRLLLVIALGSMHLFVFLQLLNFRAAPSHDTTNSLQVRFIAYPDAPVVATPTVTPPAAVSRKRLPQTEPSSSPVTVPVAPAANPATPLLQQDSKVDWMTEARRSAVAVTREGPSTQRSLGGDRPEPSPRIKQKPLGWDQTHTRRVEALPQGGILIRLSENCALAITPLPLVGCSLGKRKARGDLFESMEQRAQPGDWKQDDSPP